MRTVYSLKPGHLEELQQLFKCNWWTQERTLEETKSVVSGSQIIVGLVTEKDRLVGFARVLTDGIFKALIFDVIVDKSYQRQGLGRRLMDEVINHPSLSSVRHLELYCREHVEGFYGNWNFNATNDGVNLLRRDHASH